MLSSIVHKGPYRPEERGFHIAYRGNGQACPGCGRCNWLIGRLMAECAFCSTAIPMEASSVSSTVIVHKNMTYRAEQTQDVFAKAA